MSTDALAGEIAAKNISDILNKAWDPAWNVVLISQSLGVDTVKSVVYGYAFKEHWLWLNDYTVKISVIIWKDYNCDSWINLNSANALATSAVRKTIISKLG